MKTENESMTFKCSDGTNMTAYLSMPADLVGPYPAIIVIHEAWGLNEQIKGVTRRYANEGFVVIAPNLFTRHSELPLSEKNVAKAMIPMFSMPREKRNEPTAIQKLMESMSETDRKAMNFFFSGREAFEKVMANDLISCTDYLQNLEFVTKERIGVTGFCLGGGLAYQVSTMFPFGAAVAFYGTNPKPLETVANITGPVLGIYAGEDDWINSGLPAIVESMIRYKKTFEMKLYSGVQHGFFNETMPTYNKSAAEDAWERAVSFFSKYLVR
ncbi:MAG: dienelactone hydrolase family protein [Candidatus Nitrosopolaris sp.]